MKRISVDLEIRRWLRELCNKPVIFMGDRELAMDAYIMTMKNEARGLLKRWRKAKK